MIAATDPQEFIPSGRQQALRHPGPIEFTAGRKSTDDLLLNKLERVSFSDSEQSERWFLRKSPVNTKCSNAEEKSEENLGERSFDVNTPANKKTRRSKRFSCDSEAFKCSVSSKKVDVKLELGYVEEELYIKGNTVIWSKGLINIAGEFDHAKTTICAYTSQYPVRQAIWCTFYDQRPKFDVELQNQPEKKIPAMCVVDSECLRVFTAENEDFIDSIAFPIGGVWNTKYGIILEKQKDVESDSSAKLFSLTHPLEEAHPVVLKDSSLALIDNFNLQIVFTSEEPSVAVVYNSQAGNHCVYHIRKLKAGEWVEKTDKTAPSSINTSSKLKNRVSLWEAHNIQATPSPISSKASSFCNVQKSHSTMAAISRCQSPAFSPQLSGSPWQGKGVSFLSSHPSAQQTTVADFNNEFCQPVLCFEHIWTDYVSTSQDGTFVGPASKAFFCDDLTGQNYLCYLLPTKLQLCMVKLDFSHNANFIFGVFTSMSAKDAVPVPHLHMLAILEPTGSIVLYSGLSVVGKLHIGGVLAEHTISPFIRRNVPQFNSPFPRRSTLLPNCGGTPLTGPRFDEHLLSPVTPCAGLSNNVMQVPFQTDLQKVSLNGLRDPIENRFTLQYSDGTCYRVTIPSLASSPLIESCINVIRQTLPRDAILTLLTRWYVTRNAPGPTDFNAETEWNKFCGVLLVLLGYESENGKDSASDTPSVPSKRQKQSLSESDADWHWLKGAQYHKDTYRDFKHLLKLEKSANCTQEEDEMTLQTFKFNEQSQNSVLFPFFHIIHFSFHLLYEELKLNTLRAKELPLLVKLLCKLAGDLGLKEYVICYWKDFPGECVVESLDGVVGENVMKRIVRWSVMSEKPHFLMEFLCNMLRGVGGQPFPYIAQVNPRSRDIVQLFGLLITGHAQKTIDIDSFIKTVLPTSSKCEPFSTSKAKTITIDESVEEKAVILMTEMGITTRVLDTFPPGVALFLYNAIWSCRENPPTDFPPDAYSLLWRGDLAAQAQILEKDKSESNIKKYGMYSSSQLQEILPSIKQIDVDEEDGMEDVENPVLKMRFPEDLRVVEARRLLQSSKPVIVNLVQRPDVSDHEFIEEEEKHLYAICTRTMALPVGRGMFTLRTATPVITEPLSSPSLCLTGKATSRGTTVELTHIDTPANMNLWPLFHNGVANGLRITPDAHNIDKTWIMFNKPKGNETQMEHAGFLMALGLNGHLKNLGVLSTYDYLVKLHEMTSVGVLLGLSAAYRGTCDSSLTKALSIHVEALLPPTSMEIDVPQNLQVTALLGIGLVYQGTAHRHMTEILLTEIGRPPGPEMENSVDRESYSLAAGLALGLVTLKQGGRQTAVLDLNVPDLLHYYMVGGHRRPLTGSQRDKYRVPSFQIKEGSSVNLDVTAPGATLALGLMYLGTGNKAVADWMAPPDTEYLLDFVRPDFLMLRVLSRALIMWNEVEPTKDWIENQVPDTIRPFCMVTPVQCLNIDYEAMNQAYCNIVAGACFSVGLKYAGTADETAFQTLLHFCHMFTTLTSKSVADLAGKPTIETCLNVLLISAAMVMAGTGNLEIMRLVRYLRTRVGLNSSSVVTYGSHLMIHMALGLLFLGGGRCTLSNSPGAVAALIAAFYPKFPTHSNDNRYHLQAFRHLYVLAVEPRLIIPRDVGFGRMCYAHIKVTYTDGATAVIRGPGILPDLTTLRKVEICDKRYWPVVFERERNWEQLQKLLSTNGYVEVKQRAGCLSYMEDKLGYHSELARTLTQSETVPWDPPAKAIVSFTSESTLRNFCDNYLTSGNQSGGFDEERLQQIFTRVTYECVVKDKLVAIPIFAGLFKGVRDLTTASNTLPLWQVKLALAQSSNLLSTETLLAVKDEAVSVLNGLEKDLSGLVKDFLAGENFNFCNNSIDMQLGGYVTFYNIPFGVTVNNMDQLFELAVKLEASGYSSESINKILQILGI